MKRLLIPAAIGTLVLATGGAALAQPYGAQQGYGAQQPYGAQQGYGQAGVGYGVQGGQGGQGYEHRGEERREDGRGYDHRGGDDSRRGAPEAAYERMQGLQDRIERGRADGSLNPREATMAQRELKRTRDYVRRARQRYGQLRPVDRDYIQQRLDYVGKTIHFDRHNGY